MTEMLSEIYQTFLRQKLDKKGILIILDLGIRINGTLHFENIVIALSEGNFCIV